jgi:4'-phosphopantetheinyl transferase
MTPSHDVPSTSLEIWRLRFDATQPLAADLAVLDDTEKQRAATLLFPQERRRFVMGRAFLRRVLAQYTHEAPEAVALSFGPNGKPAWAGVRQPVSFNFSRSRTAYLLGVMHGHEIGVDLEDRHRVPDRSELARAYFTRNEQHALATTPIGDRDEIFLRLWTRKEALLKAAGAGLSSAPNEFGLRADLRAQTVLYGPARQGGQTPYRIIDLSQDGLIAAAAIRGIDAPVAIEERSLEAMA